MELRINRVRINRSRPVFWILDFRVLGDEEAGEEGVPGVVPESRDVRFSDHLHGVTAAQMKCNFAGAGLVSTGPCVCRALLLCCSASDS